MSPVVGTAQVSQDLSQPAREIDRSIGELDMAIESLAEALIELDHRTSGVCRGAPEDAKQIDQGPEPAQTAVGDRLRNLVIRVRHLDGKLRDLIDRLEV